MMVQKVYFQYDAELMYGCDVLFQQQKKIECTWEKVPHWGNVLLLPKEQIRMKALIYSLVKVYMTFRMGRRIKEIAKDTYYYTNETELQGIYESTMSILQDRLLQAKLFSSQQSLENLIFDLFLRQLNNIHDIHFDALVLFSMKPIDSYLIQAVGYGIDEMKREEAYQQFIADVRGFVNKRPSKVEDLHIAAGYPLSFYQQDGTSYSLSSLREIMNKTPLYIVHLEEYEYDISPVIALNPKKIFYYGDQPYEGKVHTLYSIFQERMHFFPEAHFPFWHQVN